MSDWTVHRLRRGEVHVTRAERVYPTLDPGSVSLVISDGPYGMAKAAWDRQRGEEGLREWYRPHVEAWGRVCAPAASVYVWGTDDSASALRGLMREHGWTRYGRITWDKGVASLAGKIDTTAMRGWADVTEVCDFYVRDPFDAPTCGGTLVQYAAGGDDRNWIRDWLASEWKDTGLTMNDARAALGCAPKSGLPGHYFGRSQWSLPTWEAYARLAEYAAERGAARDRPYFVHPVCVDARASWEHLRAEYEARRYPFAHPVGVGNVWSEPAVAGTDRLRGPDGVALHPCQKPLTFYDRIVRASSRPGDLVLEPFGGTLRAAVAIERLPEREARRYICVEPDEDGRGYVPAVLATMGYAEAAVVEQVTLW
jgi:site-specific DNA-methyltransferase (adenine-specific)